MRGPNGRPTGGVSDGRAAARGAGAGVIHRLDSTPARWDGQPIALAVRKPGRGSDADGWCVVAKLTFFKGSDEPILAVAWLSQHGTSKAISMPESVLEYAAARGVQRFFLRDDRRRLMWTAALAVFRRGKLRADAERYVPLCWLLPTAYREWVYAEVVVRLPSPPTRPPTQAGREPEQLGLFGQEGGDVA